MLGGILWEVVGVLAVWMKNCDNHIIRQVRKICFFSLQEWPIWNENYVEICTNSVICQTFCCE